jgi:hypothetical protein
MERILPHWGASDVFAGFHLGQFYQAYDRENGRFTDLQDEQRLQDAVHAYEDHLMQD